MTGSVTDRVREGLTGGDDHGWEDLPAGRGGDGGGGKSSEPERTPPPEGYHIGMWLAMVSMTILFVSLNVLYFYNGAGRKSIVMPRVLWFSTGLLIISSLTMEAGRRALRKRNDDRFRIWMLVTLMLGLAFLLAQLSAWQALQEAGFYVSRNFRSGYAYIFTALHGAHLIGGLWGMVYILMRRLDNWTVLRRRIAVDITALYWHFLDILWIYLWFLVFIWK